MQSNSFSSSGLRQNISPVLVELLSIPGTSLVPTADCQDEFSSVSPDGSGPYVSAQTENQSSAVSQPTTESVATDPEAIYNDVPAENLQHPVEGGQCGTAVDHTVPEVCV